MKFRESKPGQEFIIPIKESIDGFPNHKDVIFMKIHSVTDKWGNLWNAVCNNGWLTEISEDIEIEEKL
jgi:hypothetical protein